MWDLEDGYICSPLDAVIGPAPVCRPDQSSAMVWTDVSSIDFTNCASVPAEVKMGVLPTAGLQQLLMGIASSCTIMAIPRVSAGAVTFWGVDQ